MRKYTPPTREKRERTSFDTAEIYNHDAFGTITMTTVSGGGRTLFGSDIVHDRRIRISVQRASLHRDLSNDWIHSELQPLVEFEMSHAQFAQFITSVGNGSGTPVTLVCAPVRGTPAPLMDGIEQIETKNELFQREIKETAKKKMEDITGQIRRLGDLIESGKLPKTELKAIHRELERLSGYLPGSIAFVVEQAEEALEKATADAKIEVEAYIDNTAKKLGLKSISQLGQIEYLKKEE